MGLGLKVWVLGLGVWGVRKLQGLNDQVLHLGSGGSEPDCRIKRSGLGLWVSGLGFRGLGFKVALGVIPLDLNPTPESNPCAHFARVSQS